MAQRASGPNARPAQHSARALSLSFLQINSLGRPMTVREGSLEAPTRHPLAWKSPEFWDQAGARQGNGARVRDLPRLPPLCQPVRRVSDAVRPGRQRADRRSRRRTEGEIQGRRRPVLPVRHVLHDQVSVRAAASVEPRLSAPDAARKGGALQRRTAPRPPTGSSPRPTRWACSPAFRSSRRS